MAKLTLTDITGGYQSLSAYNANNTLIEAALENTLSRDGTTPNTMSANIDMNSNKVTNLADATNNQDAVTLAQLTAVTVAAGVTDVAIEAAVASSTSLTLGNYEFDVDQTVGAGTDNYVLTYDNATGLISLEAGSGGLNDVVDDTTPQLGGNLDLNSNNITGTGDISITGDVTLSSTGGIVERYQDTDAGVNEKYWANYYSGVIGIIGYLLEDDGTTGGEWAVRFTRSGTSITNMQLYADEISCQDNVLHTVSFRDFTLENVNETSSSGVLSMDYSAGQAVAMTLTENITSITFTNLPASGVYGEMIIKFTQGATPYTIAWPASFLWPGGTAPTMSTGSGDVDIITIKTWDGGTTWYCNYSQAYA